MREDGDNLAWAHFSPTRKKGGAAGEKVPWRASATKTARAQASGRSRGALARAHRLQSLSASSRMEGVLGRCLRHSNRMAQGRPWHGGMPEGGRKLVLRRERGGESACSTVRATWDVRAPDVRFRSPSSSAGSLRPTPVALAIDAPRRISGVRLPPRKCGDIRGRIHSANWEDLSKEASAGM